MCTDLRAAIRDPWRSLRRASYPPLLHHAKGHNRPVPNLQSER